MKKSIRFGVFETNSSSTHSLTMCSKEDYVKWENGEVLLNEDSRWNKLNQWVTKEEAIEHLKGKGYYDEDEHSDDEDLETLLRENEFYSYGKYFDNEYLESFEDTYTTKDGEEIIAFGMFGYDG